MAIKIAFYGKGGIGKSMVAANCSAALARKGLKVLLIGCDPKSDSTLSLLGRKVPSVLRQTALRGKDLAEEDVLHVGAWGVYCVESGGPEAGVGCAGMGIRTAVEELQRLGVLSRPWDAVVYDVLGDVVCGGFSVPMRRRYADRVYVVTSSEFMSLYGANNIMKGVAHYGGAEGDLFGGLILNRYGGAADGNVVERFASLTHTRVLARIPQSGLIRKADFSRCTLADMAPCSPEFGCFNKLADRVRSDQGPFGCRPLSEDELESFRAEQAMRLEERP